jgi:hypothetical protein
MSEYHIPFEASVSSWLTVEAETREEAIEIANRQGVSGLMHLDNTYPDVGEWEIPGWFINGEEGDN